MASYKTIELLEAQAHLYKHIYGFLSSMSIKWAVDLSIPDIIHEHGKPITLPYLVTALKIPRSKSTCVQRIMRLLAHNGFFVIIKKEETQEADDESAYDLTPASSLLVKGSNLSLSSMVELLNTPILMSTFHQLGKWTCGEELTIFETAFGSDGYWDFVNKNPSHWKKFNEAMESDSHVMRLALRDCKSVFEELDSLVDVGGGTGNTAKILCEEFPKLKCTVLDLPQVVEQQLQGHNSNLTFVGGDMFKSIPHADAVLLKWILHNWDDENCIKILKNCKEAISGNSNKKGGKVIIIDIVINEKEDGDEMTEVKLYLDIAMMTSFDAKERDENNWKQIFTQAGFQSYKIYSNFGFRSLIELYP